jgi:hypothetical protein
MDILQEKIINIATSASTASTASTLALFSLSTQSSSTPSSPSSPSSFTHEYDTSNYFSRLPNETIFNIFAFVITNQNTVKTTSSTTVYSPHKQLAVLSQVNRSFYKIANDVLLWQITFETKFDSEAIIRAGIIDNNLIGDSVSVFNGTEGEGESEGISPQVQNSSSFVKLQTGRNIWKELYKERQIALNKIKDYVKPALPSPFVSSNDYDGETDDFSTTVHLDDFMELNFDDENENNNDSDINTNNVDSSTLDSTDQVDDIVDYQLFDFDSDFNFIGNEKDGTRTEEMKRDNLVYTFEDSEKFQELENNTLENNITFTAEDSVKEDTVKEDTIKEDSVKEDIVNENFIKEDTVKENTVKEDTIKEGTLKEDIVKEDIIIEDTLKEDTEEQLLLKENEENVTEFDLEDNFGIDNTSVINANVVSQDLDFVSEDLIKFDDLELDSIFASDAIESDNFIDTQASNVVKSIDNDTQHNEVLVKDNNNSAKEVDHVTQAQDFSNPEINGDLDVTLQDYDESSKLLDDDVESFNLPDDEESSSKLHEGIPQLQDYEESSTKFQKSQEIFTSKLPDSVFTELRGDDLPDYDEIEEVSQSQDYKDNQNITNLKNYSENEGLSQLQNFDGTINLQDFNDKQVENSSKEIINDQEIDLPDYDENDDDVDEITNLPNFEIKTESESAVIENHNYDLTDFVDEEADFFNENITEINNENNNIENKIEQQNELSNRDAIVEEENGEFPDYEINDVESSPSNHDENENEIEEMDDMFNNFEEDNEMLDLFVNDNNQSRIRTRRKIIQQNNDPGLLKILNIIWKICQENDGMNSEVLLGANAKEFAVSLIQSLDKMEVQIECLSIALQILSILVSWHPELTIDLHKNNSFWTAIHYAMINVDMFFPELENTIRYKQLVLPASAGSAIHIFFHTNFFNLSNPSEFFDEYIPPPQLIPDSNVFNNVYNKSELNPEETLIQPFGEDLSGKWCGYYLYYAYYQPSPMRESAMDITSLEFSPSKSGKVYCLNHIDHNPVPVTDKVVKEFSGSGSDKHGEFVIKHGIITEKGNVNFVKTYKGEHSWIYDGVLLPVGICGRWGISSQWHGNFWIWKR